MAFYDWKDTTTGDVVTTTDYRNPPDDSGKWQRVFSFGIAAVPGAAGSPARPSTKKA